jgi:hypothetical protein
MKGPGAGDAPKTRGDQTALPATPVRRFRLLTAIAAVAALAVGASPAKAGLLVANAPSCATESLSQVFSPWADPANYTLAPGGRAENGSGWTLNGASIVNGNEPFNVSGGGDSHALALPDPSTATTDEFCVGVNHPDIRFFMRKTAGGPTASLRVDVLWEDANGNDAWLPMATLGACSAWVPTSQLVIPASLLPLLPGQMTPVQLRFVPQGGDFQVDDVYVDPYGGH